MNPPAAVNPPEEAQRQKAARFRALHYQQEAFILPNPWDAGSARLLAHAGFAALATTSMGHAFSQGVVDYALGRERTLAYAAAIAAATELPVSADLENGFGDAPEAAAETIRLAAAAGVVGGSIEDSTGDLDHPIYPLELAAERVRAAAEAARAVPSGFTLTARAENYLHGRPDLADTIRRLQAYQAAGADVLYAPGLKTRDEIAAIVRSLDRPVNVLTGLTGPALSRAELSALGVKRISLGSTLYRTAMGAFLRAIREMSESGTFTFAAEAANSGEIAAMLAPPGGERERPGSIRPRAGAPGAEPPVRFAIESVAGSVYRRGMSRLRRVEPYASRGLRLGAGPGSTAWAARSFMARAGLAEHLAREVEAPPLQGR